MTHKDPLVKDLAVRRQALGWSISEVSERCGIDERFLTDWERGAGSPRLDAAQRWSTALGIKFTLVPVEEEVRHGLRIDWDKRCVTVDGTPVRLTTMEWKGLERLAWTPGELVTHQALFGYLYGDDRPYRAQSTAVRVLITKLRRLLPLRIEARWGQGYMVSGVQSSLPARSGAGTAEPSSYVAAARVVEAEVPKPAAVRPDNLRLAFTADMASHDVRPARREMIDLGAGRRAAAQPHRPEHRRSDELSVIERFLAERGVTRCPDVATIQQSPLPTLVWDKMKRKWVRPALARPEAS
jgi:transcriptional regulator with XRE-family HTH domain